jgi:hypothetical protein
MAFSQTQTLSFKMELPQGIHNLLTDTIKIALFNSNASLDSTTTVYSAANEVTGAGYVSGGVALSGASIGGSGSTAFISFTNPQWAGAITARGALIYNASKSNRAICVLDFGANKTSATSFTIQFPANTSSSALIRIGG